MACGDVYLMYVWEKEQKKIVGPRWSTQFLAQLTLTLYILMPEKDPKQDLSPHTLQSSSYQKRQYFWVREAPDKKMPGLFGHCPNGGGVSTLAQMVWGT